MDRSFLQLNLPLSCVDRNYHISVLLDPWKARKYLT